MNIRKIQMNPTEAGWMIYGDYLGCSCVIHAKFFTAMRRYLWLWFKHREWRIAKVQKRSGCPLN
jgi:hypothetical protein